MPDLPCIIHRHARRNPGPAGYHSPENLARPENLASDNLAGRQTDFGALLTASKIRRPVRDSVRRQSMAMALGAVYAALPAAHPSSLNCYGQPPGLTYIEIYGNVAMHQREQCCGAAYSRHAATRHRVGLLTIEYLATSANRVQQVRALCCLKDSVDSLYIMPAHQAPFLPCANRTIERIFMPKSPRGPSPPRMAYATSPVATDPDARKVNRFEADPAAGPGVAACCDHATPQHLV